MRDAVHPETITDWFSVHCVIMIAALTDGNSSATGFGDVDNFYECGSQLHVSNQADFEILSACLQEARDVGVIREITKFLPSSPNEKYGSILRPSFENLLRTVLTSNGGETRLRGCVMRFNRNNEKYSLVGIALQLIAIVHEAKLKECPVHEFVEETPDAKQSDEDVMIRNVTSIVFGTRTKFCFGEVGRSSSFISRIMSELLRIFPKKSIEEIGGSGGETYMEVIEEAGITSDYLKDVYSEWFANE